MLGRFANRTTDSGKSSPSAPLKHDPPPVDAKAKAVSYLAAGMSITGNIVCDGTMQVFGRIVGQVRADDIEVGDGAEVEGNIIAQNLTVRGHVKGTIRAVRVKLLGNGTVDGDILHRSLAIEEHARFEGGSRPVENPTEMTETHVGSIETRPVEARPVATRAAGPQVRSIFKPSLAPIGDIGSDTSAA